MKQKQRNQYKSFETNKKAYFKLQTPIFPKTNSYIMYSTVFFEQNKHLTPSFTFQAAW